MVKYGLQATRVMDGSFLTKAMVSIWTNKSQPCRDDENTHFTSMKLDILQSGLTHGRNNDVPYVTALIENFSYIHDQLLRRFSFLASSPSLVAPELSTPSTTLNASSSLPGSAQTLRSGEENSAWRCGSLRDMCFLS